MPVSARVAVLDQANRPSSSSWTLASLSGRSMWQRKQFISTVPDVFQSQGRGCPVVSSRTTASQIEVAVCRNRGAIEGETSMAEAGGAAPHVPLSQKANPVGDSQDRAADHPAASGIDNPTDSSGRKSRG